MSSNPPADEARSRSGVSSGPDVADPLSPPPADAPGPTAGRADPVVHVDDIRRAFGDTVALDGVSFDVEAGELFGLIGPDGGGKTTLFRILCTLLLPDSGSASVLGRDVATDLWGIRARVGYMPGRFSLYPDLSVEENLRFFATVFGTTPEEGRALIAPIYDQIAPFADRRAAALSGGMKQKLALSCALVHRPRVLFLDEPTTGVDAVSRREFWELLADLKSQGLTILVSTPYMDEAARCDRVALIQEGRILGIDRPSALAERYPLPLLAVGGPDRYRMLLTLRDLPHCRSVFAFGDTLHYTDDRAGRAASELATELEASLRDRGFSGADVRPLPAGIEDAFMALMSGDMTVAA